MIIMNYGSGVSYYRQALSSLPPLSELSGCLVIKRSLVPLDRGFPSSPVNYTVGGREFSYSRELLLLSKTVVQSRGLTNAKFVGSCGWYLV